MIDLCWRTSAAENANNQKSTSLVAEKVLERRGYLLKSTSLVAEKLLERRGYLQKSTSLVAERLLVKKSGKVNRPCRCETFREEIWKIKRVVVIQHGLIKDKSLMNK